MISTQWQTVQALAPGTTVAVYLSEKDVRYGTIDAVGDRTLALREMAGVSALARSNVARVALRTRTGETRVPHAIYGAVAGAVITGSIAWLGSAIDENATSHKGAWTFFALGTFIGAGLGGARAPEQTYREQVIYIRP
jgi:hypothetical protein